MRGTDGFDAPASGAGPQANATASALAVVIERIETLPGGAALGSTLSGLDHSLLDDDQALTVAAAWGRMQSWTEAGQVRGLATFADRRARPDPVDPVPAGMERMVRVGSDGTPQIEEFAAAEAGAALGISTGAARYRLADALDLTHRLPHTLAALRVGDIDGGKARVMARGTRCLSRAQAAEVDRQLADRLCRWTWRRCEREVDAAVKAADPAAAEERRERARDVREVYVGESRDGVREVLARLAAGDATRLDARVDQLADWLGELGDTDPKAVRRATALGVLADPDEVDRIWQRVCLARRRAGRAEPTEPTRPAEPTDTAERPAAATEPTPPTAAAPTGGRPVPATVVYLHLRRDDDGAARWEQAARDGRCPLTEAEARDLLGSSHVTLRPVLDLGTVPRSAGYQPSAALAEALRLACPHDVFPFSDTSSARCQLDHDVPWPLGPTELANLTPKTAGHHRVKTHGRWTCRATDPTNPTAREWTTPTGRQILVDQDGSWTHPPRRPRDGPLRT